MDESTSDPSAIDLKKKGDIGRMLAPATARSQPMAGFDEEFTDIVDYIVKITHRIWEEKGIGLIYKYYQHNCAVHTAEGLSYGREAVVAGTIATLAAMPDRKLFAEDVIWTGNEKDGFRTSHLIINVATNTGPSKYGPPSGRRATYRGIANCVARQNMIFEEWLVRDEIAAIQQFGFDPHALARQFAEAEATQQPASPLPEVRGEVARVRGQTTPAVYTPRSTAGFDIEDFVRETFHELWNWRLLNRVYERYVINYQCHTTANRSLYGQDEFIAYVLGILAAFPDAHLTIDDLYWLGDDDEGYRVAVLWNLVGTHTGYGAYGSPTGKRVRIMGITHQHVEHGKFVREYTVFDEFALLKQLYAPEHRSAISRADQPAGGPGEDQKAESETLE